MGETEREAREASSVISGATQRVATSRELSPSSSLQFIDDYMI